MKQNAETEPGHFVLFVKTQPKDPTSGGRSRLLAKVWRYAPDWKTIVTCAVEAGGDDDGVVDAAIRACHDLKLTPG